MKNKLNVNKEDLWGQIMEDERMPKKESRPLLGRKKWGGLIMLVLSISFCCYLLVESEKQNESNPSHALTHKEGESIQKLNTIHDKAELLEAQNSMGDSGNSNNEEVKSIQTQTQNQTETQVQLQTQTQTQNQKTESGIKQGAVETSEFNPSKTTLKPIPNKTQATDEVYHTLSSMEHIRKEHTRNELIDLNPQDDRNQYEQRKESGIQYAEENISTNAAKENYTKEGSQVLNARNDHLSVSESLDNEVYLDARNIESVARLKLSTTTKLNRDKQHFDLTNRIVNGQNAENIRRYTIYTAFGYGRGFRSSKDGNGVSLGDESPYGSRLQSYQMEIGVSRKFGLWGARLGLGSDITEGNGTWNNVDTVYNLISGGPSFERIENTTYTKLHQRYGNVYLTMGVDYELNSTAWSVVPRLGLKYHLVNLTNGTTIAEGAVIKQPITEAVSRDRFALSLGVELQRQISDRFRLTLFTKYETGITYRLNSDLHQTVSSMYFGLGGQYGL